MEKNVLKVIIRSILRYLMNKYKNAKNRYNHTSLKPVKVFKTMFVSVVVCVLGHIITSYDNLWSIYVCTKCK